MRVSALIPTYNRRAHIIRAIDSILSQTAPIDEIIIVDDGSTDKTAEAIQQRYGSRVVVVRQENRGASAARARAVEEATGEWVAFLDSDDEWLPERNAAFLRAASVAPERVMWIFGDTRFVTDDGEADTIFGDNGLIIDSSLRVFMDPLHELVWDPERPHAFSLVSSFIRKSALVELGCFSEGLRNAEDYLASLQVASKYPFAGIPEVVTRVYRTSDLRPSSLEYNGRSSLDRCKAAVLGSSLAARTVGTDSWRKLHADSVRSLCKVRAQNGMSIRQEAFEQFRFGFSLQSLVFLVAAILGSRFFRAIFAAKRIVRAI